jgi:hypothetical protein
VDHVVHLGDAERFWSRVRKGDGCWDWTGMIGDVGYGQMSVNGRQERTHRLSWLLAHGAMPPRGVYVLHRCDNRRCVRPDHLFLGTHRENIADMIAKGRGSKPPRHVGDSHPQAKITAAIASDLRRRVAAGEKQAALAREVGISKSAMCAIVKRHIWREVA